MIENKEDVINLLDSLIDKDYNLKLSDNSFCFFSINDISNKESLILNALLKSFNINYYNVNDIVDKEKNEIIRKNNNLLAALLLVGEVINYGIKNILVDIKISDSNSKEDAKKIAECVIAIGKKYQVNITCIGTNESESIGTSFGKNLEIKEVIEILKGNTNSPFGQLSIKYASYAISNLKNISLDEANNLVLENIKNGSAFNKLAELVNVNDLSLSNKIFSIKSSKNGFIKSINTYEILDLLTKLGAINDNGDCDLSVGISCSKYVGDYVLEQEELAKVYLNEKDILTSEVLDCFEIENKMGEVNPMIRFIVR